MRCTTCGAAIAPDALRCPSCGAPSPRRTPARIEVERCPRCGYRGQGIPYFRRASHLVLLLGVGVFTWGVGALVYWLMRSKYRICPGCGLGWEHSRPVPGWTDAAFAGTDHRRMRAAWRAEGDRSVEEASVAGEEALPRSGLRRRIGGIFLGAVALLLMVVGIVEGEPGLVIAGSMLGLGGSGLFWWGRVARRERRSALLSRLQRRVLLLARERGGMLTVSDVAADLDLSLPGAEKVLIGMDDGFRVRSEITREGLLLYEFPEFVTRDPLPPGEDG